MGFTSGDLLALNVTVILYFPFFLPLCCSLSCLPPLGHLQAPGVTVAWSLDTQAMSQTLYGFACDLNLKSSLPWTWVVSSVK